MATPDFHKPPPAAADIVSSLEEAIKQQQEATPEPQFRGPVFQESYKWLCDIEHNRFSPQKVEQMRMAIFEPQYWKTEAYHLLDMLAEKRSQDRHVKCKEDPSSAAEAWRATVLDLQRQLLQGGASTDQINQRRLAIEDQRYWEPEAIRLRQMASLNEHEMLEKAAVTDENTEPPVPPSLSHQQKNERRSCKSVRANASRKLPLSDSSKPQSDRVLRSYTKSRVEKVGSKHKR